MEATVAVCERPPSVHPKVAGRPELAQSGSLGYLDARTHYAPFQDTNTPTTAVNDARIYGTIVHSLKMLCTSSVALYAAIAMAIAIVGERSFHALESSSWT